MSTTKNEQYHILSPEWLAKFAGPDDMEFQLDTREWTPSKYRGQILPFTLRGQIYRTKRTDLPPEAYITPPPDTTGSGREGETDEAREFVFPDMERQLWERLPGFLIDNHEGDILTEELLQSAAAELLAKLKSASPPDLLDGPTPLTDSIDREQDEDENYARGPYRTLSKQLERRLSAALAQLEALRRDGERIEWLEKQWEFHVYRGYEEEEVTLQLVEGNVNDREYRKVGTGESLRAAIDSAQRQDGR